MNSKILNRHDFYFFAPLGFIIAFTMFFVGKIYLPTTIDREYLLSIFTDHIPFGTISILFIILYFLKLVQFSTRRIWIATYTIRMGNYLSEKINQFSSPAISICWGFSIAVLTVFIYKLIFNSTEFAYLVYSLAFFLFGSFLLFINWQSIALSDEFCNQRIPWLTGLFIGILSIGIIIYLVVSDGSPISTKVDFTVQEYEQLNKISTENNVRTEDLIHSIVIDNIRKSTNK